jgi:hypothetical protein
MALIAALMSSRLKAVYVINEQMYSSSSAKKDTILFSVN